MKLARYLSFTASQPSTVFRTLSRIPARASAVWRTRGASRSLGYLLYYSSHYTGIPVDAMWWKYEMRSQRDSVVRTRVLDFDMLVDLNDRGISRQLWLEGCREFGAVDAYRRELRRLEEAVEGKVGIMDVGANTGYYVLIAGHTLDNARILAIEPAPANVELLSKNVQISGFDERVNVTQGALSSDTGTRRFYLSAQSNVHSMERPTEKSIEVPTWRLDDFLRLKGVNPNEVHVIRMDTEGHEAEILKGAENTLGGSTPMLLFIEFHANLARDGRLAGAIARLRRFGFTIAYACVDYFTGPVEEFHTYEALEDALRRHEAAEVFLTRGY